MLKSSRRLKPPSNLFKRLRSGTWLLKKPKAINPMISTTPRIPYQKKENLTICHTDVAWLASSEKAGLGWTFQLRQNQRLDHAMALPNVSSALAAEALAIREAILQAKAMKINDLLIKSDSQQLI